MPSENIVERIRKLLRLAENAGATEAEAASALERASALLLRHNLTMDQVAVTGATPHPSPSSRSALAGPEAGAAPCWASWPGTTCAHRSSAARTRSIP